MESPPLEYMRGAAGSRLSGESAAKTKLSDTARTFKSGWEHDQSCSQFRPSRGPPSLAGTKFCARDVLRQFLFVSALRKLLFASCYFLLLKSCDFPSRSSSTSRATLAPRSLFSRRSCWGAANFARGHRESEVTGTIRANSTQVVKSLPRRQAKAAKSHQPSNVKHADSIKGRTPVTLPPPLLTKTEEYCEASSLSSF